MTLLLAAFVAGALCTWGVRAFALRMGIVNHPNGIVPQHTRPVAYLGGVGIAGGAAFFLARGDGPGLLVGAAAFTALGIADDLRPLPPARKLLLQGAAAALAVACGTALPFALPAPLGAALAVAWIVVMVNAVNVTDVCDGLAGGLAVVALLAVAALEPSVRVPALAVAGATGGFLLFNRPDASIFLGDAGSHLLGFAWAALVLEVTQGRGAWPAAPQALLLAAVPLFETAFLIARRREKGLRWWLGSPDHFALRLQSRGLGKWATDRVAWGSAAALAGVAYALEHVDALGAAILLAAAGVALSAAWRALRRWEVPPRGAPMPAAKDARTLRPPTHAGTTAGREG